MEGEWGNVKPIPSQVDSTAAESILTRNTQPTPALAQTADDSPLQETSVGRDTNTRTASADREGSAHLLRPRRIDSPTSNAIEALDFTVIDFPEPSGKIFAEHRQVAADIGEPQTSELQQKTSAPSLLDQRSLLQRDRDGDDSSGRNDGGTTDGPLTPAVDSSSGNHFGLRNRGTDNADDASTLVASRHPHEDSGASPTSGLIISTSASSNIEAEKADFEEKDGWELFGQMRSNSESPPHGHSAKPGTNTSVGASPPPPSDHPEEVPSNAESRDKVTHGIWHRTGEGSPRAPPAEKVDGDWAAGIDDVCGGLALLDQVKTKGGELGAPHHVGLGVEPLLQAASTERLKELDMGSASISLGDQAKAVGQTMVVSDAIESGEGAEERDRLTGLKYGSREPEADGEAGRLEEKTIDTAGSEKTSPSSQGDPSELSRVGLGIDTLETPLAAEVADAREVEEERAPAYPEELTSKRRDSSAVAGRRDGDEIPSSNIESDQEDARVFSLRKARPPTATLAEELTKDLEEIDNEGRPVPSAATADVDWGNFEDSGIVEISGAGAVEAVESQQARREHLAEEAGSEAQDKGWSSFEAPPPPSTTGDRVPETPHPTEEIPHGAHVDDPAAGGDEGDIKLQHPGDAEGLTPLSPPKEDADAGSTDENGWGAFDEAPIAPAPGVGVIDSRTTAPSIVPGADFIGDYGVVQAPEEQTGRVPPSNEEQGGSDGNGDGDGADVEGDEQQWSDFGDFEEAPTVGKEEETSPESDVARPSDAGRQASGGERGSATGDTGSGVGTAWTAFARDEGESSPGIAKSTPVPTEPTASRIQAVDPASLPPNERNLAIMVTAFERAFIVETGAVASRGSMTKGRGIEVGDSTPSLASLTDLSHLLYHTQTSQRAPAMKLNSWTKSCILRGIRPVPDALSVEYSADEEKTGKAREGNRRVHEMDKPVIAASSTSRVVFPSVQIPTQIAPSESSPAAASKRISLEPKAVRPAEGEKHQSLHLQRQQEEKENTVTAPTVSFETPAFSSFPTEFPIPLPIQTVEQGTAPYEPAPEEGPHTQPSPPSASSLIEKEDQHGDEPGRGCGAIEARGEDDVAVGDDNAEAGPDREVPSPDRDHDDLFDDFQSAPPAMAALLSSPPLASSEGTPVPQATTTDWNLDFFMAGPRKGGGAAVSVAGSGQSLTASADVGKPLDLVSQALAGFGIDSSPPRDRGPQEGGPMTADGPVFGLSGGGPAASGVATEGTANSTGEEVGSVLSELLRGAVKKGTIQEPLSEAALSRLATLPDMSFMLSDRLRFPMRVAVLPAPRVA